MTPQTKPSAGSMRAAEAILSGPSFYLTKPEHLAELIDRESGLAELLEAAKLALSRLRSLSPGEPDYLIAAIAHAEKGTV